MRNFTVINENLIFRSASVLFTFNIFGDTSDYILYSITDLENNEQKILVSYLDSDNNGYYVLKDISLDDIKRVKGYIKDLLNGRDTKSKIKLGKMRVKFEPNKCQIIRESNSDIYSKNILDFKYALSKLGDNYFEDFVNIKDLNKAMCEIIMSRNKQLNQSKEKENIRGNINIFLITMFAISFLIILIYMGFDLMMGS